MSTLLVQRNSAPRLDASCCPKRRNLVSTPVMHVVVEQLFVSSKEVGRKMCRWFPCKIKTVINTQHEGVLYCVHIHVDKGVRERGYDFVFLSTCKALRLRVDLHPYSLSSGANSGSLAEPTFTLPYKPAGCNDREQEGPLLRSLHPTLPTRTLLISLSHSHSLHPTLPTHTLLISLSHSHSLLSSLEVVSFSLSPSHSPHPTLPTHTLLISLSHSHSLLSPSTLSIPQTSSLILTLSSLSASPDVVSVHMITWRRKCIQHGFYFLLVVYLYDMHLIFHISLSHTPFLLVASFARLSFPMVTWRLEFFQHDFFFTLYIK